MPDRALRKAGISVASVVTRVVTERCAEVRAGIFQKSAFPKSACFRAILYVEVLWGISGYAPKTHGCILPGEPKKEKSAQDTGTFLFAVVTGVLRPFFALFHTTSASSHFSSYKPHISDHLIIA